MWKISKDIKNMTNLEEKLEMLNAENSIISIPLPTVTRMEEDLSESFKLFKRSWYNYIIASVLNRKPEEKIAVLLTTTIEDVFKILTKRTPKN